MLIPLESASARNDIGAKARRVLWLLQQECRVPRSFCLVYDAGQAYRHDPKALLGQIQEDLESHLDLGRPYAVRSSADLEDQADFSFAGQFTSKLGVLGRDALTKAIGEVLDSADGLPVQAYLESSGHAASNIKMGVLIQEMVAPQVSGVAFSRNPLTGLNEVVIEAVQGSGEALHQDGITPEHWVHKWGYWTARPEETKFRVEVLEEVAAGTRQIATAFGKPVDLEWVHDGDHLYWVQMRPITGLDNLKIYSNRIAREVLPGIIKPLVWSINTPMVNRAWIDLFTELIGPNKIQPEDLAQAFHYRAYFNMATIGNIFQLLGFPADSLELLMGIQGGSERPKFRPSPQVLARLPRMLKFALEKVRFDRRMALELPVLETQFQSFAEEDLEHLQTTELLDQVEALIEITQQAAYFNIVIPLLMRVYNALIKRQLDRLDFDFAQVDLTSGIETFEDYDPKPHLAELYEMFHALDKTKQDLIRSRGFEYLSQNSDHEPFLPALLDFLARFGHLSDSGNDFSIPPWGEDPDVVLQLVAHYHPIDRGADTLSWEALPLAAWRRITLQPIYRRAQAYRLHREAISSLYTFGYGLFRRYFLALADRFIDLGLLDHREDIFYLYFDEVRQAASGQSPESWGPLITYRRQEIEACQDIVLPEIIYGDQPPPIEAASEIADQLSGTATSRGYYRGPAKVIQSTADFHKLEPGDVLVIPYSDVAWTPLFAKAGAVVAEAGGILSHSSIVAREFAIPCVVSVDGACRIPAGSILMVDGYKGEVHVSRPSEGPGSRSTPS